MFIFYFRMLVWKEKGRRKHINLKETVSKENLENRQKQEVSHPKSPCPDETTNIFLCYSQIVF